MPRRTIIVIDARKPREKKKKKKRRHGPKPTVLEQGDPKTRPDWTRACTNCGQSPIVPVTGLCGPCTFGEADTIGGNW